MEVKGQVASTTTLIIDNTCSALYRTCPMKYYWRIVMGYVTRATMKGLSDGRFFHDEILAPFYQARMRGEEWEPGKKLANPETGSDFTRTFKLYREVFKGDGWKPLAVEVGFVFQISPSVLYCGRLDLITDTPVCKMFIEHKTTGLRNIQPLMDSYELSDQITGYAIGSKIFYPEVEGAPCVNLIQKPPMNRFHRYPVTVTERRVENFFKTLGIVAKGIRNKDFYQDDSGCFTYGRICQYYPLCMGLPFDEDHFKIEPWVPFEEIGKCGEVKVTAEVEQLVAPLVREEEVIDGRQTS